MNSSLERADIATHTRIVILALVAGIVIVLIGISVRTSATAATAHLGEPRSQAPIAEPSAPPTSPVSPNRRRVESV